MGLVSTLYLHDSGAVIKSTTINPCPVVCTPPPIPEPVTLTSFGDNANRVDVTDHYYGCCKWNRQQTQIKLISFGD